MFSNCRLIDLSHELAPDNPTWSGGCGFESSIDLDYETSGCRVLSLELRAGQATHMDAPSHFVPGTSNISELQLSDLFVPLIVIRVRPREADYFISEADLDVFEQRHGPIPAKSLVVADTGWAQYWSNERRYRNVDEAGGKHFPGFDEDVVSRLLERDIVGIGIDTLSPDGSNMAFPVHHLLLGRGKYILENLANLHLVPETGAWMVALPMKIKEGTEAPCRCVAVIPMDPGDCHRHPTR